MSLLSIDSHFAAAQQSPSARGTAPQLPPAATPDVRFAPPSGPAPEAPPLVIEQAAPLRAPPGAEGVMFRLTDLSIEGVTVYGADALRGLYADVVGTEISLEKIYDIRAELQIKYREDGYFLTRVIVPPQEIREGAVRLRVIEGYVSDVRVEGDIGPVQKLVESYLNNVLEERPLHLETLERYLLLANDIPGITVVGVLQPSADDVGAAQLVANAKRKWYDVLGLADNFGSTFTGEWEFALVGSLNSFSRYGEQISATGLVSIPESDIDNNQKVGQFSGSVQIGDEGTLVRTRVSYGNSLPAGAIRQFLFDNTTLLANVEATHPFVRSRNFNVASSVGFDYIDTDTDVFNSQPFTRDRLRVIYLNANLDFRDEYRGATLLSATVRQGLPIFNATRSGDGSKSRPDGTGLFTSTRLEVARLQGIYDDLALFVRAAGQYSFSDLLQDEEFGPGGLQFGRGFAPKEVAGDHGVGATAELQYTWRFDGLIERLQAFGFYDYARVWQRDDGSQTISSAGGGLRFWPRGPLSFEIQSATPLARGTSRAKGGKDTQILFRGFARF